EAAHIYVAARPLPMEARAEKTLAGAKEGLIDALQQRLELSGDWSEEALEAELRAFAEAEGIGFGKVAQPLRAALTGRAASPGLFEVMRVLGKDEVLARLGDAATGRNPAVQHKD
ncbi:MAG: glutamate--tRNA ligase, partial [Geminicoccaceae bacterium]|nr:glutamate--tRNA ligase [Geminicoccaceae bacterium]